HTANDAVLAEGKRLLIDDPSRFDGVKVIGVDEHVWRHTRRGDKYVTVIIDLTPARDGTGPARLLDMVEGRSKAVSRTGSRPSNCRPPLPECRRPHLLSVLLGRTIDRIRHHAIAIGASLDSDLITVACIGGGCAHDSTLRVLLAASLLVPGLARTAGDSRLGRGIDRPRLGTGPLLPGDLALRGRRCRVLSIAQHLLARRGRLRVSTGLTHTQTALARIDQRVRELPWVSWRVLI